MCDVMNTTYIVGRYAAPTDPYYYNARPALGCQQALPGVFERMHIGLAVYVLESLFVLLLAFLLD